MNELKRIILKRIKSHNQDIFERYSASLAIREIEIKIALEFCFTPVRMVISKKRKATNTDEDVDKEEPYPLLVKNASLCSHKGIRYRGSS